jgi:iron complex outermembrane receptor protein
VAADLFRRKDVTMNSPALRFARLLFFSTFALASLGAASASAQTARSSLSGHVLDAATGAPLADARVAWRAHAEGAAAGAPAGPAREVVSDAAGRFVFDPVPAGAGSIEATRLGYRTLKRDITAEESDVELRLEAQTLAGPSIEVTTTRPDERGSAVAFTRLDRDAVKEKYWAQDVPMLLAETPGVFAYSDAGNGIGYSYVKVRGFSQSRVAVTINGIPLNDPQSHEVYWVDHPDLLASASSLQVQRGVGNALYGASAVGGSINLETTAGPGERNLIVETGGGSYGTTRVSVQGNSGLLDNRYVMSGRYSRIVSDGYREQSWSDLWSYAFAAARFDKTMTTRLNFYGGPENLHLAYYAVDRSYLDGRITGDAEADRRFNPLTWRNETDNFFEPHYELLNDFKLGEKSFLSSSLFYFPGKGYYDDFPYGPLTLESRRLPNFFVNDKTLYPASYYADTTGAGPYEVVATDLTQRLWAKNKHYGWAPRARFGHKNGELTVGGEWREADGRRWGELTWGAALPPGTEPNHVMYDYLGQVNVQSVFAQESYDLRPNVRATGSLQWRNTRYAIGHDLLNDYNFKLNYTALNPRLGLNWNASQQFNVFGSYAHVEAEPILTEIYHADDPTSVPLFRIVDPANDLYVDPLIDPEQLNDWEAGLGYTKGSTRFRVTGYWLDFKDEIVPNGQIGPTGVPITGNAAASTHRGVELEAAWRHSSGFDVSGNLSLSQNFFDDYHEYVDSVTVNDYSGNSIAGFPARMANVTVGYGRGPARLALSVVDAGVQYLDNSEDNRKNPSLRDVPGYQRKRVEASTVLNGLATVSLGNAAARSIGAKTIDLDLRGFNLTNLRYESSGYVYAEVPYYYPSALRSFYVSLRAAF